MVLNGKYSMENIKYQPFEVNFSFSLRWMSWEFPVIGFSYKEAVFLRLPQLSYSESASGCPLSIFFSLNQFKILARNAELSTY